MKANCLNLFNTFNEYFKEILSGKKTFFEEVIWAFVLVIFLNLPWFFLNYFASIDRPLINIDYLLCFLFLRWKKIIIPFFFITFLNDVILNVSSTYHFGILNFIKSIQFISNLNLLNITTFIIVLVLLLVFIYINVVTKIFINKTSSIAMFTMILILAVVDVANGSFFTKLYRSTQFLNFNIVGSGFKYTAIKFSQELAPLGHLKIDDHEESANKLIIKASKEHKDRSVLIVLVESMGAVLDPNLDSFALNSAKFELRDYYGAKLFKREFIGATTSNELKVLCGLSGDYRKISAVNSSSCIPLMYKSKGMPTVAVHGFDGYMFSRKIWWSTIGFNELFFKPDLSRNKVPNCGGMFAGSCDVETLDIVKKQLIGKPKLVYFLTLNTHLPFIPRAKYDKNFAKLCTDANVNSNVCELEAEHLFFLKSLSKMLKSLPREKLPIVIVTGDHSPPFINKKSQAAYSQEFVPMMILEPLK